MTGAASTGLWVDETDAHEQIAVRAGGDELLERIGRDLIDVGFTVIPGRHSVELIEAAHTDYYRYLDDHSEDSSGHRDTEGRHHRLTNFHVYSDAAMRIAKNEDVMRLLDFLFGRRAAVYTSLTFQYSTMQALHRDAPYFHTFPPSMFFGVWTAFEDIHPDSGPLSYVPGSHRLEIDQVKLYREALERTGDPEQAHREALSEYQRQVTVRGEAMGPREYAVLKRGDVAIWHGQLIHGGSPSRRPELTRHSMVVHCCPEDVFVYQDDVFVRADEGEPRPRYRYVESMGRKHPDRSVVGFMDSI